MRRTQAENDNLVMTAVGENKGVLAKRVPVVPITHHSRLRSMAGWISEIKDVVGKGRASTIELAQILCAAKRKLLYGQWTEMWKSGQIPFSKRKGEMLVVIGRNLGNLDAQNSAHLPLAWNTLYYLARLDCLVLENLILDGIVHPGLTLNEAKELFKGKAKGRARKPNLRQRLQKLQEFIQGHFDDWTNEEREWARCELLRLAGRLRGLGPTSSVSSQTGEGVRGAGEGHFPCSHHSPPQRLLR